MLVKRPWSQAERKLLLLSGGGLLAVVAGVTWTSFRPADNGVALSGSALPLVDLVWSSDSKMIAAAGAEPGTVSGSSICIWQMPSGQILKNTTDSKRLINHVEFSPDNLYLVERFENNVDVWNIKVERLTKSLPLRGGTTSWKGKTTLVVDGSILTQTAPRMTTSTPGKMQFDTKKSILTTLPSTPTSLSNPVKKEMSPSGSLALVSLLPVPGVGLRMSESRFMPNKTTGSLERVETRLEDPTESVKLIRVRDNKLLKTLSKSQFKLLWWQDKRHLQGVFLVGTGSLFKGVQLWTLDCQTMQESWQPLGMKSFDGACITSNKRWLSCNERTKVSLFDLKRKTFIANWETNPDSRTQTAFSPDSHSIAWIDGDDVRVQRLDGFA